MLKCLFCGQVFDEKKATNISGIIYCPNCGDTEAKEVIKIKMNVFI